MVSDTAKTQKIRERKQAKMGKKRKNKLQNQGSTKSQEQLFGSKNPS